MIMTSDTENPKRQEEPSKELSTNSQKSELDALPDDIPPEIVKILKDLFQQSDSKNIDTKAITAELKYSSYRGNFVPPQIIEAYEEAFPGAGKWLLEQTEKRMEASIRKQDKQIDNQYKLKSKGQFIGAVVACISLIVAGITFIYTESVIALSILVAFGVGGPVAGKALFESITKIISPKEESAKE